MKNALEDLNLGRLRVASKGLERKGDALVEVAREEQLEQGMYMIGQVAALRSGVSTVRECMKLCPPEVCGYLRICLRPKTREPNPAATSRAPATWPLWA